MIWQDARVADVIKSNDLNASYVCQARCSTDQGQDVLQKTLGTIRYPCCDGVFIPSSQAENVIGYDVQSLPVQYRLSVLPNNLVSYGVQVQGDFYNSNNYRRYPFDK